MLRISKITEENNSTLRLEGTLAGPWVEELGRLCSVLPADDCGLTLDCGGVSFADTKGLVLLQALRESGISLDNCSPFLEWQLGEASITSAERGGR